MADELEDFRKKLTLTEEEEKGIVLGGDSTKAAKELGENCLVMQILTQTKVPWPGNQTKVSASRTLRRTSSSWNLEIRKTSRK